MFDRFGEFDSAEEINRTAAGLLAEGDMESLKVLAEENGIDKEDAQDYAGGCVDVLATPLMAALGKIEMECRELKLQGVLTDWKDTAVELCTEDPELQKAVRKKGKCLKNCMAAILRFAFENKVPVSEAVVKATRVTHNGKEEAMRGPVYLGFPNRRETKQIIRDYYMK